MEPSCLYCTYVICTNNNLVNFLFYHLVAYFTKVHEIKRCSLVHVYLKWFPFNMPFNFGVTLLWIVSSPFHTGETTKIGQLIYFIYLLFNLLTFMWFTFMLFYYININAIYWLHLTFEFFWALESPKFTYGGWTSHSTHNTFRIVIKWNQNLCWENLDFLI